MAQPISDSAPLRMVFVMDPLAGESVDASTTFVLLLEAQSRGHEIFYADPGELSITHGETAVLAHPVHVRRERGNHFELGESRRLLLDADVDVVFQRKDPPVDSDFIAATQLLGTCRRALVLNRPSSILAYNEKLFAVHFRELMPETAVTRRIADLKEFMAEMGGEMIVKPLDGKGGEGIFHVVAGERNMNSILEQATGFGSRWVMAQRYVPDVRRGDKRILLLEGEPIGAVLRVPSESEVRANLHVGGRAAKARIEPSDQKIIDAIAPRLVADGLFFVGIDVIGGLLTEINVTSPTGVQEINALDGVRLEAQFMDRVELRIAEARAGRRQAG